MSVVTPEIRFFADCHWLMADNIILLRITPMLPYEWSNLRRLFDCKSTFETRSGPFDYWRIRLEFDGNLIHWTVSDGWWHPKTTTFDTDYETTMTVLFDVGYDQWRKDRGIMDEADKAVKRLNDSGIPATRSSDPDYLVFEVGESVFRALLPADPTHAASRLIEAVRNRGKILDGYRKTVAGLGRVEALEADDVYWDDLFSNGDPVETGAVIFQSQGAEDHPHQSGPADHVGRHVAAGRFRLRQGGHGGRRARIPEPMDGGQSMKSITKAQYAMLFFAVDRLKEDSWYTGPYGFDALKERGLVDFGQHDRIITDEGIAFVKRMLADPESMPMTAKRAIAEYDVLRDEYAHLFEHDPDMRVRVAMFGVHGLEPVEPPTGIDGFRTDTIYDFKDLDVLSATFAITHLYSGFNPNHHVIVRAHESYTDPPAPVIDSINNRQLRQSGGTRYLKVSRTVLDKEKQ